MTIITATKVGNVSVSTGNVARVIDDLVIDGTTHSDTRTLQDITEVSRDIVPEGAEEEDAISILQTYVLENDLTAEESLALMSMYPEWEVGLSVEVGQKYRYAGSLYRVEQKHTTQADRTPDIVPALFTKVVPEGVIPEWVQPTGAQDAYQVGDKVSFEGHIYESLIAANVWSPTAHPAGWKLIS